MNHITATIRAIRDWNERRFVLRMLKWHQDHMPPLQTEHFFGKTSAERITLQRLIDWHAHSTVQLSDIAEGRRP